MDVFTQGERGFSEALAATVSGRAKLIGERYDEYGRRQIVVGHYRRNDGGGVIKIGNEYFSLALKDYRDWPEKWWREAVQNAVDAGARSVRMSAVERDGNWQVECEDDGAGMSRETLLERFLVLGGSGKSTGATVGGFGKAKELLILPWISWRIESHDYVVDGAGASYDIRSNRPRKGLLLQVVMPPDKHTDGYSAKSFLSYSQIDGVRFTVDGKRVDADLRPGKLVRELEQANIYYNEKSDVSNAMLVRVHGLFMFSRYLSTSVKGVVVVELTGRSTDLLTANRDGFANWQLGNEIDKLSNEIAADTRSALRGKTNVVKRRFEGGGLLKSYAQQDALENVTSALLGALGAKERSALIAEMVKLVAAALPPEELVGSPTGYAAAPASAESSAAMLEGVKILGAAHAEAAAKALAWEPDFFIWNEDASYRVPSRFEPENMSPALVRLARLWAELCRFVLVQLGKFAPFGIGWTFSDDTAARYYRHEDGSEWLLLNPFQDPKERGSLLSASSAEHLPFLYSAAIHEATHMVDRVIWHDEGFAAALTKNMAKCFGRERQVKAIRRSVTARVAKAGKYGFEV